MGQRYHKIVELLNMASMLREAIVPEAEPWVPVVVVDERCACLAVSHCGRTSTSDGHWHVGPRSSEVRSIPC